MTSPDTDTGMLHDREPYDPPTGEAFRRPLERAPVAVSDHAQAIYDVLANAPVSNFTSLLGPNERDEIKRHADALAAERSMPMRDQGLYQAAIKQMDEETPEEWQWGFVSGAKVASRLAAERLSPNGDLRERIRRAIYDAIVTRRIGHLFPLRDPNNLPSFDEYTDQQLEICGRAADAVLAALAGPVQVPDGWHLKSLTPNNATLDVDGNPTEFICVLWPSGLGNRPGFTGHGPTWQEALAAAIRAAEDGDR